MDNPGTEQVVPVLKTTSTGTGHKRPWWIPVLIAIVVILLIGLIAAPVSLSAQDIVNWARQSLGLKSAWPWVAVYALDATAIISVLVCVYFAWKGRRAVLFQFAVWTVASISALGQYKHGTRIIETAPDAWWFFPAMALLGPIMLEMVMAKLRELQREKAGQVAEQMPKFGLLRWIPGIGSFVETYGAWRVARLMNLKTYDQSVHMYRQLCPDGGMRVLKSVRAHQENRTEHKPKTEPETTPIQERATRGDLYLYRNPVQEQPIKKQDRTAKKTHRQDNQKYLEIIRSTWPNEIPSGYQIRTKLKVNYSKSVKLIEALEEERKS